MSPTAIHEISRTPRTPKYSLITSVMMNTNGQTSTPAVKLSVPSMPNSDQLNGGCADGRLEREDLHTHEFADQRVGEKEAGEEDEQAIGALVDGAHLSIPSAQAPQLAPSMFVRPFQAARREGRRETYLFAVFLARRA